MANQMQSCILESSNSQIEENSISTETLLELYWNYYQHHAEQRMKILEFFIAVESALFCAEFVAIEKNMINFSMMASVSIVVVAILSYLLDKRTTDLLHICRGGLRIIENRYMQKYSKDVRLFTKVKEFDLKSQNENDRDNLIASSNNSNSSQLSKTKKLIYSNIIRAAYAIVALIGILCFILA